MSTWSTGVVPPGQECIQNWQLQLQRVLPVFEVYCTRRVQYSIVDVPTVLYLVWYLTKTRTVPRTTGLTFRIVPVIYFVVIFDSLISKFELWGKVSSKYPLV